MKRLFLTLFISMLSIAGMAQAVGDWTVHPVFGTNNSIIDTKNNVYYLSGYNVYCYDKVNDETISFNRKSNLSDTKVSKIFYDFNNEKLVVIYANSNIDIVDKNGKVANIPDFRDVIISYSKNINDVTFAGDKMYVATDFGYLVIDTKKAEVKESHFYGVKVNSITENNGYLVLAGTDGIYTSAVDAAHFNFSSFTLVNNNKASMLYNCGDYILMKTGWTFTMKVKDDGTVSISVIVQKAPQALQMTQNGTLMVNANDGNVYRIDADGKVESKTPVPAEYASVALTSYNGTDYWGISSQGVCQVRLEQNGTTTLLKDYARPNASTVWYPQYLVYNNTSKELLVCNVGSNANKESYDDLATISTYDGSFWKDLNTFASVPTPNHSNDGKLRSPYSPVYDPEDPSIIYLGSWYDGLYRIKDGEITHNYNQNNAPYVKHSNWCCLLPSARFDNDNNLWTINSFNYEEVFVLPRAKQGVDNTTKEDWVAVAVPQLSPEKSADMFFTKKGIKILHEGKYGTALYFLNDNGTLSSTDDTHSRYVSLIDQDEKSYTWRYIFAMAEDLNGRVWMGTTNGVVEFSPDKAFSSNFRVNHIKVPRNDGTNYADYLLENQSVLSIAVDGANRKWLGTLESGLYLVSSDGSEIIAHYTTDNSLLPSNQVISVCCNPNNNSVYVGTNFGMVEFASDAYPAADSYNDVYAYPNPVRPDYTGYITVRGLMDNSLVKITDAAGNVIYSGMSTGGMFTWNGNNADGSRVPTGVYYVLASQSGTDKSSGAVTKIMIIN